MGRSLTDQLLLIFTMLRVRHAPALVVDPAKPRVVLFPDQLADLEAVPELRGPADSEIFLHCDRLPALVDHLVHKERSASTGQVPHPVNGPLDVIRPHVLGRVHPEADHTEVDAVLEVLGDFLLDVGFAARQVIEAHQVAVPDLCRVAVVLNITDGLVEVLAGERNGRVALTSPTEGAARTASALAVQPRHVVDHGVHEDVDPGRLAPLHHLPELLPRAGPALQLVGDRLVANPPLLPLDVLHRRGDLDPTVTPGPEDCLALSSNVWPRPLEQMDDHLAVSLAGGVGVTSRQGADQEAEEAEEAEDFRSEKHPQISSQH